MKILTAFYSRSGRTKKIGELIASELQSDVEEFSDTVKRSGLIGWLRCGYQAMKKITTELNPIEKNPSEYDLVLIGTPIWGGTISVPTRTYIIKYADKFKSVAFFCTAGGDEFQGLFAEMESVCGKKPVAVVGISRKEFKNDMYFEKLKEFIAKIQK